MKKLINFFCLIGIIFFFPTNSYSQQSDVLIRLSPSIGDELNLMERNHYGMYPEFEGFVNAVFYKRGDEYLITKITYKNNLGENKDIVIVENKSFLGNLRASIRIIDEQRIENFENSQMMTLTTNDEKVYKGILLEVYLNHLFMIDDLEDVNDSYLLNNYRLFKKDNIKSVFIKGKDSKTLKGLGNGFLIGAGTGALIGLASGNDESGFIRFSGGEKALMGGIVLGILGGIVGLISSSGSTPDELIMIKTDADYNRLKGYLSSYNPLL